MRTTSILFYCFISIFISACHSKQSRTQTADTSQTQPSPTASQAPIAAPKPLQQSIIDSFTQWQHFKTVTYENTDSGYMAFLQDDNAVLALQDSFIIAYAYRDNEWKIVDSVHFDCAPTAIYSADMNDDTWPDVVVTGFPQMNGNTQNYVLLSDTAQPHNLRCRPDLTGWHLTYSQNTRKMYSWFSGSFTGNGKEISRWQGDSLRIVEGVEWWADNTKGWRMQLYKMNGKKKIITRTIKNFTEEYALAVLFPIPY